MSIPGIQTNQSMHFVGFDNSGGEVYLSLNDILKGDFIVGNETFDLTLSADANLATVAAGTNIIGQQVNNGGLFFNQPILGVITDKTVSNATVTVDKYGATNLNSWVILDAEGNEVLAPNGDEVRAVAGAIPTEGTVIAADDVQLSFAISDGTSGEYVAFTLPAGSYKIVAKTLMSKAAAISLGKQLQVGNALTIDEASYEELVNLLNNKVRSYHVATFTEYSELAGTVLSIKCDSGTWTVLDGTTDISAKQQGSGSYSPVSGTVIDPNSFECAINGKLVKLGSATLTTTSPTLQQVDIDLTTEMNGSVKALYADAEVEIRWK